MTTVWAEIDRVGDSGGIGPAGARGADARDIPGLRLSLVTANPIPLTDTSGTNAVTIYYTPYNSSQIMLYDTVAAVWRGFLCPEISASLSGLTTTQPYDVYVYSNTGVPTLELVAWTNSTTRATDLTVQNGVYVKTGDASRRFVGTLQMQATGQCEDSVLRRYVFNYYNRVRRSLLRIEATDFWQYATASWRQANAATANQVSVVNGGLNTVAETMVHIEIMSMQGTGGARPFPEVATAIAVDVTNAPHSECVYPSSALEGINARLAVLNHAPTLGKHDYVWIEYGNATNNATTIGTGNAASRAGQSGISGHAIL